MPQTYNIAITGTYSKIAENTDDPVTAQVIEGGLVEYVIWPTDATPTVRGHVLNEGQQMSRAVGGGFVFARTRSGGAGLLAVTK